MDGSCWLGQDGVLLGDGERTVAWWSFGKVVLAAAALRLVERGALELDQPLRPAAYSLRNLLQNRAGLPEYGHLRAYHDAVERDESPWTLSELSRQLQLGDPQAGRVGDFAYSNLGYVYVRSLIEQTTGQPLLAALESLVLAPLGIENVRLAEVPSDLEGVDNVAPHYHPGWVFPGLLVGPLGAAVKLLSTLVRGSLLTESIWQQMSEPVALPEPWTGAAYGLGLMLPTIGSGQRALGHTGNGPGGVIAVYAAQTSSGPVTAATWSMRTTTTAVERRVFEALVELTGTTLRRI